MCEKKAKQVCKYPVRQASPVAILGGGTADPSASTDVPNWRSQFRNLSEMEEGEIVMVIDGVLQEGTCFTGAHHLNRRSVARFTTRSMSEIGIRSLRHSLP
jgi:hypothetical protein